MKDVMEVLRAREQDLIRVREEVEALRLAAPLLTDEEEDGRGLPKEGSVKRSQRVAQFP